MQHRSPRRNSQGSATLRDRSGIRRALVEGVRAALAAALHRLSLGGATPDASSIEQARRALALVRLHDEMLHRMLFPALHECAPELILGLEQGLERLGTEIAVLDNDLGALGDLAPSERPRKAEQVLAAFARFTGEALQQFAQQDAILLPLDRALLTTADREALRAAILHDWDAEGLHQFLEAMRPIVSHEDWRSLLQRLREQVPTALDTALGLLERDEAEARLVKIEFAPPPGVTPREGLVRLVRTLAHQPGLVWQLWSEEEETGLVVAIARIERAALAEAFRDALRLRFRAAGLPEPSFRTLRPEHSLSQAGRAPLWI